MVSDCAAGLLPPTVAVKLSDDVVEVNVYCAAAGILLTNSIDRRATRTALGSPILECLMTCISALRAVPVPYRRDWAAHQRCVVGEGGILGAKKLAHRQRWNHWQRVHFRYRCEGQREVQDSPFHRKPAHTPFAGPAPRGRPLLIFKTFLIRSRVCCSLLGSSRVCPLLVCYGKRYSLWDALQDYFSWGVAGCSALAYAKAPGEGFGLAIFLFADRFSSGGFFASLFQLFRQRAMRSPS